MIWSMFLIGYFQGSGQFEEPIWGPLGPNQSTSFYHHFEGVIWCSERTGRGQKISDPTHFEVLFGTDYGRDRDFLYYPRKILCWDSENDGLCFCEEWIVPGVNPAQFKYLGKEYGTDQNSLFFRGEKICDLQRDFFELVEGPRFFHCVKSENKVFLFDQELSDFKVAHFQYFGQIKLFKNFGVTRHVVGDGTIYGVYSTTTAMHLVTDQTEIDQILQAISNPELVIDLKGLEMPTFLKRAKAARK